MRCILSYFYKNTYLHASIGNLALHFTHHLSGATFGGLMGGSPWSLPRPGAENLCCLRGILPFFEKTINQLHCLIPIYKLMVSINRQNPISGFHKTPPPRTPPPSPAPPFTYYNVLILVPRAVS